MHDHDGYGHCSGNHDSGSYRVEWNGYTPPKSKLTLKAEKIWDVIAEPIWFCIMVAVVATGVLWLCNGIGA